MLLLKDDGASVDRLLGQRTYEEESEEALAAAAEAKKGQP